MNNKLSDKQIQQKVFQGAQPDGITDIFAGICLFSIAYAYKDGFSFLYLLPIFLFGPVLRKLRNRFTYTRYGYVKIKNDEKGKVIGSIFGLMALIVFTAALVFLATGEFYNKNLWLKWLPLLFGILHLYMYFSFSRKTGSKIYLLLAGMALVTGVFLSVYNVPENLNRLFIYFNTVGIITMLSGIVNFYRFVKSRPENNEGCLIEE